MRKLNSPCSIDLLEEGLSRFVQDMTTFVSQAQIEAATAYEALFVPALFGLKQRRSLLAKKWFRRMAVMHASLTRSLFSAKNATAARRASPKSDGDPPCGRTPSSPMVKR
jgi:hypothetical protein